MKRMPVDIRRDFFIRLNPFDQAARFELRMRIADIEFVTIGTRIGRNKCRSQEDAAVPPFGDAKVATQFIVGISTGRLKQAGLTFIGNDHAIFDPPIEFAIGFPTE